MKILIVDDEPLILHALQRVLGRTRPSWTVSAVEGGVEALMRIQEDAPDLVMADLDMPGLDGIALLTAIRDHHPDTVRVVLSGTGDPNVRLRTSPLAHRFVAKPCEIRELLKTLDELVPLAQRRPEPMVAAVISVDSLPAAPPVYAALSRAMAREGTSIRDLEEIVMRDQAISAKVLQIVNSAFFGLPRVVTSLPQALSFLGLSALRSLVLTVEAFKVFDGSRECPGFSFEDHRVHGLLTSRIASRIAPPRDRDTAFTAGLLHDVGTLILASRVPQRFAGVLTRMKESGRPLRDVEQELLGTTHEVVGADLLTLWGLPGPLVRMVADHHRPGAYSDAWGAGSALRVADVLAYRALEEIGRGEDGEVLELDPALEPGVEGAGGIEAMEEIAREEAGRAVLELSKAS